jgi:hypothetical protein
MADTRDGLVAELQGLRSGVVDTSTLIYLDRLGLLQRAARCMHLVLIPQVVREYGGQVAGTTLLVPAPAGPADRVVCAVAARLDLPVLSDDGTVLRAARRRHLRHYNTLMLILALCIQGDLARTAYPPLRDQLCTFARYSADVLAVGDALFQTLAV